jgi:serine/threonine protein kinase
MDKTTYIQEAERQLSDCRFYEKLDSDPTLDFTQKIIRALEAMHARGHLDNKTMEYLTPEDPKPGRFYLLPKIHKENNPGRPIVSANGHPTEKISKFIDFLLRPFVENLPSHIKDTTDYLKKMENLTIPENITLVTIDVTSL